MKILFNCFYICFVLGSALPALGSTVEMRTRLLTSLTNIEVEAYLDRNDVIFIPVGVAEVHGAYPVDCEYIAPLALSIKMAEKVDGLVLPNLIYFYPGATSVGKSTVFVSPSEGLTSLKVIARSLLHQGFKTQIYVTGHGLAFATLAPLQMEFMNETKNPKLITAEKRAQYAKEGVEKINKIVAAMDVEGIVRDLKEHRKYTQEVTVPKYGDLLPYVRY